LRLAELGAQLTLVLRDEERAGPLMAELRRRSGNATMHVELADLCLMADVESLVRRMRRRQNRSMP
jgi:dehydrogenase/reductase SDR family protein 12